MAMMKAVCIHAFGGPEVLEIDQLQVPEPSGDQVLVKIHAASINPVDYKIRSGKYPPVQQAQLPKILGRDMSGTVERCGPRVRDLRAGEPVYAMLDSEHGGYAEYVALNSQLCVRKPDSLNHTAAAAVPLAGITAWQGLFDHGKLEAGQRVLIHGGGGGVGHFAIQFAKACGATVCTTVSLDDLEFVRQLGADEAIDYEAERFEEVIDDVDLVLDLIGGDTQERSWSVLKKGGAIISTLQKPSESRAREHGARAEHYVAHPDAAELQAIGRLIEQGKVRPHVAGTYRLDAAAEAQERIEHAHVQGKLVLEVAGN